VDNASTADQKQLALDALVTFLTNPFVVYRTDGATDPSIVCGSPECPYDRVVKTLTVAQLSGAYGITDKIQVGANLPFVFSLAGAGPDPTTGRHSPQGLQVTGLGDLLVEGKMKEWENDMFHLAGIAGVTIPTSFGSDGSKFLGDDLPTLRGREA